MKKFQIMKTIDTFIFVKLDELSTLSEFQKITEAYSGLEENIQEIVKALLMAIIVLIPLVFVFIFSSMNSSIKKELETKDKIIHNANELIQKKSLLSKEERNILATNFVDTQSALQGKISNTLSMISVDSTKVNINNFDTEELEGLITKVKADLSFKGFTDQELFAMVNSMVSKLKIRIDEISIKKNETRNILDGIMTVHYYSKDKVVD
jgi:hypothetical protein